MKTITQKLIKILKRVTSRPFKTYHQRFWIVVRDSDWRYYRHRSAESAIREAHRLATKVAPGDVFHVMQVKQGVVQRTDVTEMAPLYVVKDGGGDDLLTEDDIPF